MTVILLLKILTVVAALGVASYQDLRTRKVDDRIWYVAIAVGVFLTGYVMFTTSNYPLALASVSMASTFVVALLFSYLKLWGGADSLALVFLAVTMPLPPYDTFPLFPFTVFVNGTLLFVVVAPIIAVREYMKARDWKKFGVPMVVFIFAGFVLYFLAGDALTGIMKVIVGG